MLEKSPQFPARSVLRPDSAGSPPSTDVYSSIQRINENGQRKFKLDLPS